MAKTIDSRSSKMNEAPSVPSSNNRFNERLSSTASSIVLKQKPRVLKKKDLDVLSKGSRASKLQTRVKSKLSSRLGGAVVSKKSGLTSAISGANTIKTNDLISRLKEVNAIADSIKDKENEAKENDQNETGSQNGEEIENEETKEEQIDFDNLDNEVPELKETQSQAGISIASKDIIAKLRDELNQEKEARLKLEDVIEEMKQYQTIN